MSDVTSTRKSGVHFLCPDCGSVGSRRSIIKVHTPRIWTETVCEIVVEQGNANYSSGGCSGAALGGRSPYSRPVRSVFNLEVIPESVQATAPLGRIPPSALYHCICRLARDRTLSNAEGQAEYIWPEDISASNVSENLGRREDDIKEYSAVWHSIEMHCNETDRIQENSVKRPHCRSSPICSAASLTDMISAVLLFCSAHSWPFFLSFPFFFLLAFFLFLSFSIFSFFPSYLFFSFPFFLHSTIRPSAIMP